MKYNRQKQRQHQKRIKKRVDRRHQNDEKFHRKRKRREEKLKLDRKALAVMCGKLSRLSRDGFAITGTEESPPTGLISPEFNYFDGNYFNNGPWHQLATEDGLWNPETRQTDPWINLGRKDIVDLLGREWRSRQKKSPLWRLAECAE